MNTDTWLVVPLYNEGTVVGDVIRHARKTFSKIVCVDDGSADNSGEVAAQAGAVVVTVSPKGKPAEGVMNLRAVTLRPTQ